MKSPVKKSVKKVWIGFGIVFLFLFIFRLLYGYLSVDDSPTNDDQSNYFSGVENVRKNYASEKIKIEVGNAPSALGSPQKFEKTAFISSSSAAFEQDERAIKEATKSFLAIIQYEQRLGSVGERAIHLSIGVTPEKFDAFFEEVIKVGQVKENQLTKVDKTNDYKQLNAKKLSIEKTLASLNELKVRGGKISEFVSLNYKILEIEERLQELGVELGNFDEVNEFCTVKFSLYEGKPMPTISFLHRIKVAFEWAILYFSIIVLVLLGIGLVSYLAIRILEKIKSLGFFTNHQE